MTIPVENEIKKLVVTTTRIDGERISITFQEKVIIEIAACTENEQREIQAALFRTGFKEHEYAIIRGETLAKPPAYPIEKLHELITVLGKAPDGQLDKIFAKRCAEFSNDTSLEDTLKFIRNLRDECVFSAGASNAVMHLFSYMLEDYPEVAEVKEIRRAELDAKYGIVESKNQS